MLTKGVTDIILAIASVIVLNGCNIKRDRDRPSKFTVISVAGSSGQGMMNVLMDDLAQGFYVKNLIEGIYKIKISGHQYYSQERSSLLNRNSVKVILVYRDPRDNLKDLIYRSLYAWRPSKWSKPYVNELALRYHEKVVNSRYRNDDLDLIEHYVDSIGAQNTLDSLFSVLEWRNHTDVLIVRWENLAGLDKDYEQQYRELKRIASFIGVKLSDKKMRMLAEKCSAYVKSRGSVDPERYFASWNEVFSTEDRKRFKALYGDLLIDMAYEKDYNW